MNLTNWLPVQLHEWGKDKTRLLDLRRLNCLLPSGRDNFSAAENLTAVSAHSRLPPSSCPWARRCCLPSALSFTIFLHFHVSLYPFSLLQILITAFSFLSLPTPYTHSYILLGFSNRPMLFPYPSEHARAQPGGSRGDTFSFFSWTLMIPMISVLSNMANIFTSPCHLSPGLLYPFIWAPASSSAHSSLLIHPTALRMNFLNINLTYHFWNAVTRPYKLQIKSIFLSFTFKVTYHLPATYCSTCTHSQLHSSCTLKVDLRGYC